MNFDEINRTTQALEAMWGRLEGWQSAAEVAVSRLRENEDALARGALAQAKAFEDAQTDGVAAMQRFYESQNAIAASMAKRLDEWEGPLAGGVLAQVRQFEDTQRNIEAAQKRLLENQDALALAVVTQAKIPMVDAMASIQRRNWIPEIGLVKTCFDDARLLLESVSGPPIALPSYVQSLLDSQKLLESTYGSDLQAALGWNLQDTIAPALVALRGSLVAPDFAFLAGNDMGGLLTLVGKETVFGRERSLLSAPLLPAALGVCIGPRGRVIQVRCNVTCKWCGEPLIASGRDQVIDGSSFEVTIDLTVVPLCPTCLKRAEADPTYFEHCLGEPASPELTLIRGLAESTSGPRGRAVLRLVQRDQESGDEE